MIPASHQTMSPLRSSVTSFLFYTQGLSLPGTWLGLDWRCQKAGLLALSGVCVPLFLFKHLNLWVVCPLWLTRILSSFYHLQQEDVEGTGVTPEKNPLRQEYLQGGCLSQSRSRDATRHSMVPHNLATKSWTIIGL